MHLALTVQADGTTFTLEAIEGQVYVIGRYDPDTGITPDVDLTAFDGFELGVSRHHALLFQEDGTCYLRDAGSSNGTFINGKRLIVLKAVPLQDGDWLQVGKLMLLLRIVAEG